MLRRLLVLCVLILLIVPCAAAFGQADPQNGDAQWKKVSPQVVAPSLDLIKSKNSAAILTPTTYMGFSTFAYPDALGICCDGSKVIPCIWKAAIHWYGPPPTMGNFTTLTYTLSSLPPGPLAIGLGNNTDGVLAGYINVDSTSAVFDSTNFPNFFQSTSTLSMVFLIQVGSWTTGTAVCPPVTPTDWKTAYPGMQWGPASVTLFYQ